MRVISITLFAHSHRQTLIGEGRSQEPGLYVLSVSDCDDASPEINLEDQNESGVIVLGNCQTKTLIAIRPLDKRDWRPMKEGELLRAENGVLV